MISTTSSFRTPILVILSGNKSFVLRSSHIFRDLKDLIKLIFPMAWDSTIITIATTPENIDLFNIIRIEGIPEYKIVSLTPDGLSEILSGYYELIVTSPPEHPIHSTALRLTSALSENGFIALDERFRSFSGLIVKFPLKAEVSSLNEYFLTKPPHPIDIVYTTMPHKVKDSGMKIIGVNIGENDEPSLRPPISILTEIIQMLYNDPQNQIVLFGAENLKVRYQMIMHGLKVAPRGNATVFSALRLGLNSELLAQAIPMCDLFISFDSFMMDLAVAFDVKTVCLV